MIGACENVARVLPPIGPGEKAEFRLLGGVRIVDGAGRDIPPGPAKRQTVLAALLLDSGRLVTVDALVDRVWGDTPPPQVGGVLRAHLSRIRTQLVLLRSGGTRPTLVRRAGGYVLEVDPGQVDVHRLRSTAAAAAAAADDRQRAELFTRARDLWTGDPLAGLSGCWVEDTAEALRREHADLMASWADAQLRVGRVGAVVGALGGLVNRDRFDEVLAAAYLRALAASGRPAQALAEYGRIRDHLVAELGSEPGPELRAVQQSILHGERAPGPARAVHRPPVPRQAPAGTADFVGRRAELDALRSLLPGPPDAATTVCVAGMAGVGKSSLVLRTAYELRAHFPAGCLYADLHGGGPRPADPAVVLGAFLRALGVAGEALPTEAEERAALLRSVLAERRLLVLLDDALDERQVRPLLPGPGGTVLMTSRRPLSGLSGARMLVLDPLPPEDGVALLASVAGRRVTEDPASARRVVELCGRLPLAIRIAGVRLDRRDGLSTRALADRLADERRRLDELATADLDVRASLDVGVERLPPAAVALLGRIATLAVPAVDADVAGALLDVPAAGGDRLLEQLCDAQLLAVRGSRYRPHDLVRLHARERALAVESAADLRAATVRAYRMLLELALRADRRLPCRPTPPLPSEGQGAGGPADPAAWFEEELPALTAAAEHAVRLGEAVLAGRFVAATANYCIMRGRLEELEHLSSLALAAVTTAPEGPAGPALAARVRLTVGNALRLRDRNQEALPVLRRAYQELRAVGDGPGAGSAALAFGVAASMLGRSRAARAALRVALGYARREGRPEPWAGYVFLAHRPPLVEPGAEIGWLQRAMDVFEATGEAWGRAEALTLLGAAFRRRGELEAAEEALRAAIAEYAAAGDRLNQAIAQNALAHVHLTAGRHQPARELLQHTLATARELRHPWGEATALRLIGELDLLQGRPAAAVDQLQRAVWLLREIAQPVPLGRALESFGRARLAVGDRSGAIRAGREAMDLLDPADPEAARRIADWLTGSELS